MITLTSETDKDYYYVITELDGTFISSGMVAKDSPTTVSTKEGRVVETFDTEESMIAKYPEVKP